MSKQQPMKTKEEILKKHISGYQSISVIFEGSIFKAMEEYASQQQQPITDEEIENVIWEHFPLPLDNRDKVNYAENYQKYLNLVSEVKQTMRDNYKPSGEIDYKTKYEKCIDVIKRFDAGIISMYDL